MSAPLDAPIREALARLDASPWNQNAMYLLYTSHPEALADHVRHALDEAVGDALFALRDEPLFGGAA